jgi:hypothetical protein
MNTPPRTPQLSRSGNNINNLSPPSIRRTRQSRVHPYARRPVRMRIEPDLGEVIETESEPEEDELRPPVFSLDDDEDIDNYYDDEIEPMDVQPEDTRSREEIEESLRAKMEATESLPEEYEEAEEDDPNKCFYSYGYYDVNIQKYLDKHPDNFVIEYGKNVECESLSNLKKLFTNNDVYDIYYECSASNIKKTAEKGFTPISFSPEDYYTDTEYVKVSPTTNIFIVKPDWMYDGPVPEPRRFKLVNTGVKKRLIERSLTESGANVVSGIHCDPLDTFDIYKLEPITLGPITLGPITLGGKKKKHTTLKHRDNKYKINKHNGIKHKKSKKVIKKSINKKKKITLKRNSKKYTRRIRKNKK